MELISMKKFLLFGILAGSILFGKWGTWKKVQGVYRKQPIDGTYMAAIFNDNKKEYKSIFILRDDSIVVEFGDEFQLPEDGKYTMKFRVDYKKDVKLTGNIGKGKTIVPLTTKRYVIFDPYSNDNLEKYEQLMKNMTEGQVFKIYSVVNGKERLHQISLTGFSTIFNQLD